MKALYYCSKLALPDGATPKTYSRTFGDEIRADCDGEVPRPRLLRAHSRAQRRIEGIKNEGGSPSRGLISPG